MRYVLTNLPTRLSFDAFIDSSRNWKQRSHERETFRAHDSRWLFMIKHSFLLLFFSQSDAHPCSALREWDAMHTGTHAHSFSLSLSLSLVGEASHTHLKKMLKTKRPCMLHLTCLALLFFTFSPIRVDKKLNQAFSRVLCLSPIFAYWFSFHSISFHFCISCLSLLLLLLQALFLLIATLDPFGGLSFVCLVL